MIHGSSCEANLPLIVALSDPIPADLELNRYEKMLYEASSPNSGCVLSTINHCLRRLIQKTVARSSWQVKLFKSTDRVIWPAFPSMSALQYTLSLQTQRTIHFKCLRQQLRKATVNFPTSACLSFDREQIGFLWMKFHEILYCGIFIKLTYIMKTCRPYEVSKDMRQSHGDWKRLFKHNTEPHTCDFHAE
jgi:hypothetical protein